MNYSLCAMNSFSCDHCHECVHESANWRSEMAVQNRNHCPFCLWSKHVDETVPGDRKSACVGLMVPIGLTIKRSRNKYAATPTGELMLIHRCEKCEKININRIAADDETNRILDIFANSTSLDPYMKAELKKQKIRLLRKKDKLLVLTQVFGRK